MLKTQGENLRVLVTGICRAQIREVTQNEPYMAGYIRAVPETEVNEAEKASSPDIVTVLLLCGVCFAAAILITSGILNRRRPKKEPKH